MGLCALKYITWSDVLSQLGINKVFILSKSGRVNICDTVKLWRKCYHIWGVYFQHLLHKLQHRHIISTFDRAQPCNIFHIIWNTHHHIREVSVLFPSAILPVLAVGLLLTQANDGLFCFHFLNWKRSIRAFTVKSNEKLINSSLREKAEVCTHCITKELSHRI